MARRLSLIIVLAAILSLAWMAIPVVAQWPSPGELRLTAAALRVNVAADSASAKAIEAQAKEIERQQAQATAEQKRLDDIQTAIYKPTLTPQPTIAPAPTGTPIPTVAVAQPQSAQPEAASPQVRSRIAIYLENVSAPAMAVATLIILCGVLLLVGESLERRKTK